MGIRLSEYHAAHVKNLHAMSVALEGVVRSLQEQNAALRVEVARLTEGKP